MIGRLVARFRRAPDDPDAARIRMAGFPGRGTVVAFRRTGRVRGDRREVADTLDVYVPRLRRFRSDLTAWLTEAEIRRLEPGHAVPIAADQAEPGHVVLAFDMDEPVSIAGLGPVAGGPGGPVRTPRGDEPGSDRERAPRRR